MALPDRDPNTIVLSGPFTIIGDLPCGAESITPGWQVKRLAGAWVPNDSNDDVGAFIAMNQPELNKGIDDPYAPNDLMKVAALERGALFLGVLPSGQDLTDGTYLTPDGATNPGMFNVSASVTRYRLLRDLADDAPARARIEVI